MKDPVGFRVWVVRVAAVGYLVALVLASLAFRLIGERWWLTAAALYLPRLGFAVPLPFVALMVLFTRRGRRWLLATQAVAVVLLLFPLMGLVVGLHLPGHSRAHAGAFRLRVMSYNVDETEYGTEGILRQVRAARPDVLLLQEIFPRSANGIKALQAGLTDYNFRADSQFIVASRFPLADVYLPPEIPHRGKMRSPRWLRYRLATPGGPIDVFNLHPISPRKSLDELRGHGLERQILTGAILSSAAADDIIANASLRVAQVSTMAAEASGDAGPVIIAGDTNLPGLSWAFGHWLGGFQDAFVEAGAGFGYTFPAAPRHPWMRIDRVLANGRFRVVDCFVSRIHASEHLAVIADLELETSAR